MSTAKLGLEETVRFVFSDAIAKAAPRLNIVSATPVTAGCRMVKSEHELHLDAPGQQGHTGGLSGGLPDDS